MKTLEGSLDQALQSGNKEQAAQALQRAVSALDKAAKSGVIHRGTADRKKSRLSLRLAARN